MTLQKQIQKQQCVKILLFVYIRLNKTFYSSQAIIVKLKNKMRLNGI